jgi:hypothetical protein
MPIEPRLDPRLAEALWRPTAGFFSFNDVSSSLRRHTWNPKRKVSVYLFAVAIPTRFHNDARVFQPVLPP